VDAWPCEANDVHNFEWRFNATSGALVSRSLAGRAPAGEPLRRQR
jgi:hypothetical protein